tara:strand:- start:1688 stop:2371 length:684 start_codon:yes stop_codon:yes gene_type:complete
MKKVYGKGINDAGYVVRKYQSTQVNGKQKQRLIWFCPYYDKWKGILRRCLSEEYKSKHPTYQNCEVDSSWLLFSVFRSWCENYENLYKVSIKDSDIDKDILVKGNNIYSPERCCLVHNSLNKFLTDNAANRGDLPVGVSYRKEKGVIKGLRSRCKNPYTLKEVSCGCYPLGQEDAAHEAWRQRKHKYACELADSECVTDERVAKALRERYSFNNWYNEKEKQNENNA